MYQALLQKKILVFGCGNPLMGDDGFGPAVIEHITKTHPQTDDPGCIKPGLSREVNAAVPKMCRKVARQITTILPQEIPC